jgi:hypothetical protein
MSERSKNPAFWAMVGIPAAAVLASFWTLFIAIDRADAELPASFATEGAPLEKDFELRAAAAKAGITVELSISTAGLIEATLRAHESTPLPSKLELELTHISSATRDRRIELRRTNTPGLYRAEARTNLEGRWTVRIGESDRWHLLGQLQAPTTRIIIGEST